MGIDQSLTRPVMAATHLVYTLTLLVLLSVLPTSSSPYGKRAADALAVGDAEPISAMNGFYGNPLYRPYGFGAWGYGSAGYMKSHLVIPGVYGGYHYYGFHHY